jgi:hypothetical protein
MNRYRATYRKSKVEEKPKPIVATYEAQNSLEAIGLATKKLPALNNRYNEDLTLETVELITYDTVYSRDHRTTRYDNVGVSGDNVGSNLKGGDKMKHPTTSLTVEKAKNSKLISYQTDDVNKFFEGDNNE